MARKKIVFVIVEGASDETALGVALNQVFDRDSVHVHIMHGDITTRTRVNPKNIVARVGDEVRTYAKSNHYTAKDFKQIIHIVDTDAVYIPDEKIIEEEMHSIQRYTNLSICLKEARIEKDTENN